MYKANLTFVDGVIYLNFNGEHWLLDVVAAVDNDEFHGLLKQCFGLNQEDGMVISFSKTKDIRIVRDRKTVDKDDRKRR